jgi:enoyl-CoA hydratase/carnithine racemase
METLIVERAGGVVTVTMNRPERKNAANGVMLHELQITFEEVERSPADRVMVLTGAGGAFCAGADLTDRAGPTTGAELSALARMRRLGDVALMLHRVTKPTIAKVDGHAVGAGLSLALGCDLVVCTDRAKLSAIFSRRGLSLDMGASWLLPRIVGLARAKEIALFGDVWPAEEALAIGLVNRVVPPEEIDAFVDEWARTLAEGPPLALSLNKTLLNNSAHVSMEQALENEARCQAVNSSSQDTREGLAAFAEKRKPTYIGR